MRAASFVDLHVCRCMNSFLIEKGSKYVFAVDIKLVNKLEDTNLTTEFVLTSRLS